MDDPTPTPTALTREPVRYFFGVYHSCDGSTVARLADRDGDYVTYEDYESQRLTIARLERERDQAKGNYAIQQAAADDYERQLSLMRTERDAYEAIAESYANVGKERDAAETERIEWVQRAQRAEQRAEELQARVTELEETVRQDGRV